MQDSDVLFYDKQLLAVAKPAGVLSQGDRTGDKCMLDLAQEWLSLKLEKNAFLASVHRLDRPVSGVVVYARNSKAAHRLSTAFRRRHLHKIYYAVVSGLLQGQGTLVHALLPKGGKNQRSQVLGLLPGANSASASADVTALLQRHAAEGARRAVLSWRSVCSMSHRFGGQQTLLRVRVHTGRKHQIRAQLAAVGHPIVGDVRYGAGGRGLKDRSIALHARLLALPHPIGAKPVVLLAPLPPEWERLFGAAMVARLVADSDEAAREAASALAEDAEAQQGRRRPADDEY